MNAEILLQLESCKGDSIKLRAALYNYIAAAGVNPTEHYVVVLEYVYKNRTHPSGDQVYDALSPYYPDLSRSKVYTILELLSRAGVIKSVQVDQYNSFFDGNINPHPHFICTRCGKVSDLEVPSNADFTVGLPKGALVSEIMLNYLGICPICANKDAN